MPRNEPTALISVRVPVALRDAIDVVVRRHEAKGEEPSTLREATVTAYLLWLQTEGETPPVVVPPRMGRPPLDDPPAALKRPVGRPPKPPFTLPEGTDAQALWNEFWTMAYTQGWTTAASWATQKYHTTIGGFDHAVRAALPEDVRPTREALGLVSEKEWIEQQVAAALGPGKGKGKT